MCLDTFDETYFTHYDRVRHFVMRRVDAHDVDDVVAETFIVAWRRWDDLPQDSELQGAWLLQTARLTLLNFYRSGRRRSALWNRIVGEATPVSLEGVELGSAYDLEDSKVIAVFQSLGAKDREILALVAWEGCSIAELATILKCSQGAARTRLSRARARFRQRLTGGEL